MFTYKWDDSLKTTHYRIDSENRMILEKVQSLSNAIIQKQSKHQIKEEVIYLKKLIQEHFAHEEMMQLHSNFEKLSAHKRSHAEFIQQFTLLTNKIIEHPRALTNVAELNQLISGYYYDHIQTHDFAAAKYLLDRDYYRN